MEPFAFLLKTNFILNKSVLIAVRAMVPQRLNEAVPGCFLQRFNTL